MSKVTIDPGKCPNTDLEVSSSAGSGAVAEPVTV